MSKNNTNISKEVQVLLKLLRLALGTEPMTESGELIEPFPEKIDWKRVILLSYEHKVSALAADGFRISSYNPYGGLSNEECFELNVIVNDWNDDVLNIENEFEYYKNLNELLFRIFKKYGIKTIILKGVALAQNYPIPEHRGAGDIDVFFIDSEGNQVSKKLMRLQKMNWV